MRIRWVIAIVGVIALAALTVDDANAVADRARDRDGRAAGRRPPSNCGARRSTCPGGREAGEPGLHDEGRRRARTSRSPTSRARWSLLDFWATWCGPCKVEIPHFIEFQEKYATQGLQVVGISVDDTVDKLEPYVRDMKMNYPVLQGLGHDDVQDAYGPILGIPVSVMISRDGKVCATHTGLTGKDIFEREIKALL